MENNMIFKKEQRLKQLEAQIKKEKCKLNEKLGKTIIDALKLGYDELNNDKIKEICNVLKDYYNNERENNE